MTKKELIEKLRELDLEDAKANIHAVEQNLKRITNILSEIPDDEDEITDEEGDE